MNSFSNTKKPTILAIDDDQMILDLLANALEDEYVLITASNAKDAVQDIHQTQPQLILLDVNLTEISGLEVARLIKNDPDNNQIPIIFMSGQFMKEDRIAGYEAGGIDYITKPFTLEELRHKIKINIEFHQKINKQNQIIDETRQMAFTAMSQSGEIGQILHFMRDSFTCDSYEKLSKRIIESMEGQQLSVAFRIHCDPPLYFSHEGQIARLDQEILDRLHMLERIIDFGKRSVYNFPHISLLVKNMPIEDDGLYGRIKDNVCLILEAADSKAMSIQNESILLAHEQSLTELINKTKFTLREIETSFQANATKNSSIMLQLKEKIEWSFLQLGLTEDQEKEIFDLIQDAENQSTALYDEGLAIEERIAKLTSDLNEHSTQ